MPNIPQDCWSTLGAASDCTRVMPWAVFRALAANPKFSGKVFQWLKSKPPSIPFPPASTSPPAWSCATGPLTSELLHKSWCPLFPRRRPGSWAGSRLAATWNFTITTGNRECKYFQKRVRVHFSSGEKQREDHGLVGKYWINPKIKIQ